MPSRQEMRSEETKDAILTAAGQLFAERGFDVVTMREIAKQAGCSHTTIYNYFKDKEALLHQLSMAPLASLRSQMEAILHHPTHSADDKLRQVGRRFIYFCLSHRNLFDIFFMTKTTRVDEPNPVSEVNQMRLDLFDLLRQAIQDCLQPDIQSDTILAYARIYFFGLHGILATYKNSEEPLQTLLARLTPTFELQVDVMLAGFRATAKRG